MILTKSTSASFIAGSIENAAYGKGLKAGGLNTRNDGKISMGELQTALSSGSKLDPQLKGFAQYLKNNFKSFDKGASGITSNGGWATNVPDGKLQFSEISRALSTYFPSLGPGFPGGQLPHKS